MTFKGEAGLFLFFMPLIGIGGIAAWAAWQLNKKSDKLDEEIKKRKSGSCN